MSIEIQKIADEVQLEQAKIIQIKAEIAKALVGQNMLVERLIMGLLVGGHILVEGLPGLAKTTAIKTLAQCINIKYSRLQFTPDLLPADVIGTQIYNPQSVSFSIKKGPIFTNLLLADEINRAPAKVQSALLEAMQERQVTIANETFNLDEPFLVMATQNPIEQQGTYPLPEAQLDRFMMKLKINYPEFNEELEIMNKYLTKESVEINQVWEQEHVLYLKKLIEKIYIDDKIKKYILQIVASTRDPDSYKLSNIKQLIACGASPRASLYLAKSAKAYAFLQGRAYVTPYDIKQVANDVMRHRILLSYEAEAEEINTDKIINIILENIDVP